jgi:hypothetical protein
MSSNKKNPAIIPKEAIDSLYKPEDGWNTMHKGPWIPNRTIVPGAPLTNEEKDNQGDTNTDYNIRIPDFKKIEGVKQIMQQTEEFGGYDKEFSEPTTTKDDGLKGSESIRTGIDAEILQTLMNKGIGIKSKVESIASQALAGTLAEEEAAIIDDLKRQMEAKIPQLLDQATHCPKCGADIRISQLVVDCTKCTWFYVPLQVSYLFKK